MELTMKGTPSELKEFMEPERHKLIARIKYRNHDSVCRSIPGLLTEQEIDDQIIRDVWHCDAIKRVDFYLDNILTEPVAFVVN